MRCESVILAAGQGTRMRSSLRKVLHPLLGRPMLAWAVAACREATGGAPLVEVGGRGGRGDAFVKAWQALKGRAELILVMSADMPLLRVETLRSLIELQAATGGPLALLSHAGETSRGFGRVVRSASGRIERVVEEAHATPAERAILEYNASVYCFRGDWLWVHLAELPISPKGEYYLTDLVEAAARQGGEVV